MQFDQLNRRKFITLLGGAAATLPLTARAQQPAMPVIGFLDARSLGTFESSLRAFRQGLKDNGYVEGENAAIEYRGADNQIDRLPGLAAELVRRRVAVIVAAGGTASVWAAKAATTTVPIVFLVNEDPVKLGLVTNLARPGSNLTGINFFNAELVPKRLVLLRELIPGAARIVVLVDPADAASTEATLRDVEPAARAMGLQILVYKATTIHEIDAAFTSLVPERPDALFIAPTSFFFSRRSQLVNLASRYAVPTTYSTRDYTEIGGLMSYGTSFPDTYRHLGAYVGRVLKGAKPVDLPVMQSTKFEFVINLSTARMLGLTVPPSLLALADEVIE